MSHQPSPSIDDLAPEWGLPEGAAGWVHLTLKTSGPHRGHVVPDAVTAQHWRSCQHWWPSPSSSQAWVRWWLPDWDLSLNEMVNHEYAHHVQRLAGITTAKLKLAQTDEIERRAELQAMCWSATMTRNSETVGFAQDDWDSWQQRLETMILDGIHGSRESIRYWGTRGLYAETLGDCNTWSVDAGTVS